MRFEKLFRNVVQKCQIWHVSAGIETPNASVYGSKMKQNLIYKDQFATGLSTEKEIQHAQMENSSGRWASSVRFRNMELT